MVVRVKPECIPPSPGPLLTALDWRLRLQQEIAGGSLVLLFRVLLFEFFSVCVHVCVYVCGPRLFLTVFSARTTITDER